MSSSITIQKDSEFFIATCQFGVHSYVTLGVKGTDEVPILLAGFGKYGTEAHPNSESNFFCSSSAEIQDEHLFGKHEHEVHYKAYAITLQHYLQFLNYMKKVSAEQVKNYFANGNVPPESLQLYAYGLLATDEHSVTFEWNPLKTDSTDSDEKVLTRTEKYLSPGNTCRHAAIHLTEIAREAPGMKGEGISSWFFKKPPLKAIFLNGKIKTENQPFYILPLPPTAFADIIGEKKQILNDLYWRLDKMVLIAACNQVSVNKFSELKTLYQSVATQLPPNIFQVIAAINTWEMAHKDLIKAHRGFFWTPFATATEKMFTKFHKRFEQIQKKQEQEEENRRLGLDPTIPPPP